MIVIIDWGDGQLGKTVLILGGGTGGVVAGNVLRKTLKKKHQVIIVDRNDYHYFQASYPFLMVNQRRPAQVVRRLEAVQRKGIEFRKADVIQVYPEQHLVETSAGMLGFDYLVISLGAEHHLESVPGQEAVAYNPYSFEGVCRLRHELWYFTGGNIVLFISNLPYTGVIAPYEIIFLIDAFFRERGLRQQVTLTLVTPEPSLLPLAGPKVGESLRRMLEQRQIRVLTQAKVLSLDPVKRHLMLDGGISIPGDLFIGIPSHWGPSVLCNSNLVDDSGWIEVDPHTMATRAKCVYAVGDATGIKLPITQAWGPKAGVFTHYQAEVVARNIASVIAKKSPDFRYTGKAAGVVMATGFGSGRVASVKYYARPYPRVALLRSTRIAYWTKIAFEKYWLNCWL